MYEISEAQLQAFETYCDRKLIREIAESLLVTFPEETMGVNALMREITPIVDTAHGWGITDGPLLALHVYACKVLGCDYYSELPFAGEVMTASGLEDEVKKDWLLRWLDAFRLDSQS